MRKKSEKSRKDSNKFTDDKRPEHRERYENPKAEEPKGAADILRRLRETIQTYISETT